ncbi:MAG: T9SS type A sorting domain-containing protein [Sphingobacteriales bacterium]|nr:MAG: T9SS type A sorting domain-containing protein [Sphingobacteriales bacterium]
MRKFYSLLALGLLASASSMAQNQGGPDAYGYTWKSNAAPGGPAYNWIDITGTGTTITALGDDNVIGPLNLGFSFRYYWTDITQIRIGSNGYVLMGTSGSIASQPTIGFPSIPTASNPNNVVAPYLTDLNFDEAPGAATNPGQAYFYTNNADSAIISFVNVPFWTAPADNVNEWSGSNTFQIIFSKADSSITFQYQSQSGNWNASYDASNNPLVIGMENITGGIGLQISNNMKPAPGTAYKFYYPDNVVYQVTDAAAVAIDNDANKGFFGVTNSNMPINTTVANVGNQDIAGPFNVRTTVRKASISGTATGAFLFDKTAPVSNLNQGDETNLVYTDMFLPPSPPVSNPNPSYIVSTALTLTGDQNPTNNTTTNELVILDTAGVNSVMLRYHDADPTLATGTGPGAFGFEGAGVYFEPPFYPVQINTLNFLLVAPANAVPANGYTAKIFLADANGNPAATPVFTQALTANDVLLTPGNAMGYNNIVPLAQPVSITSGGFYVTWEVSDLTGTQNVFLATDDTGPFSRQSYEILFGNFGEYRSGDIEDLFIGAEISLPGAVSAPNSLASFSIGDVYPNPAATVANVKLSLTQTADVTVKLTNITGQEVKQVNFGTRNAGESMVQVPVSELASGVYVMTFVAGNETVTRKLVITK